MKNFVNGFKLKVKDTLPKDFKGYPSLKKDTLNDIVKGILEKRKTD